MFFVGIASKVQTEEFGCVYGKFTYFNYERPYACNIKKINCQAQANALKIKHLAGKSDRDLTVVQYQGDRSCKRIPRGFQNLMSNLEALYFKGCGIKTVSKADLSPLPKLILLHLGDNKISYLEGNLFQANLKLKYVVFEKNELSFVSPSLFDNFVSITLASFYGNPCVRSKSETVSSLEYIRRSLITDCSQTYSRKRETELRNLKVSLEYKKKPLRNCILEKLFNVKSET